MRDMIETCIDDLKSLLEKLIGFVREMVLYTTLRGGIRLIDMHAACRPTQLASNVADIRSCATNSVIKNEDTRCSSALKMRISVCLIYEQSIRSSYVSFRSCSTSG
jgi:hypothetical protein